MDSQENWKEQSAGGSASHGGGKACHRCKWVFPNQHPSRKQRAAHRKNCGAAAPKPTDDAVDVTGAMDEEASDRPGEVVAVEESKSEGGERKAAAQSGGDSVELSKAADNSPELHALHHNNKVQSSNEESKESTKLVDSAHPDNHSVTHEDTESYSLLPSVKESLINASEETSCATTQNVVESAIIENNNSTESYAEVRSDLCISELLILPHDSSRSSSSTDAGFQKIDKYLESSAIVELEEKADVVGQIVYKGKCTSGTNAVPFDVTTHSLECEFQTGKDACSYVNPSEPEDQQTLPVGSGATLRELKPESLENSGFETTVPSTFSASSKNGSDLGREVVPEIPNVVLSKSLVAESDQNTNNVFPNMVVNEGCSLHSNDDQYCRDENSGNSQLVNELELVESITKFDSPHGELDCFRTEKQIGSLVLSAKQAVGSGSEVTNSCETCYSPTEFQDHNSHLYCEGTLADNLRNEDSAVILPDVCQFSARPEISTKYEILSQEAMRVDGEVVMDEEKQEWIKEESFYLVPKIDSQPEDNITELESPFGYEYSDSICNSHFDQPHFQGTHQEICNASIDEIIEHPNREVEPLVNEAITENGLPDDHCNKLNIHEGETSNVEIICGSQQDLQNVFEARNADPVCSNKNNLNPFTSGIDHFLDVEQGNSTPNILNKESNSKSNEVSLCHDEKMVIDCDSKTIGTQGDSSSIFYQSSKVKNVNEQIIQQVDSYTVKIDESIDLNHQSEQLADPCTGKTNDSIDSNKQDGSIETILSISAIESPRYEAIEGSNCDAKASPPADSQATKDLCISDDPTAGALQESTIRNNGEVEESSLVALVEPMQTSLSTETKSILDSKHEEPEGRNISCDAKASVPIDSQATRDLFISDVPTIEGALHENDVKNNSEVKGSSSVSLVEPGRISISTETKSIPNSKHEEPERRNISYDAKASPSTVSQATDDPCISDDPTAGSSQNDVRNNSEVESSSLVPLVEPGQMSISIKSESILNSNPEGRNISCDAKASEPTDSQSTKDLCTSDDPTSRAALPQSIIDNNGKVEGSSSVPLVEPGRKSISIETESTLESKHEPEGRNISEESTARMLSCYSGKPHVMLKNLLAEANTEGKQMNTNGQGDNASSTSKKSRDLQDGHSDKPKKHCMNHTDHKEWNSPARLPLPATKHEKKKSKGKQSWVPFICCPSMN